MDGISLAPQILFYIGSFAVSNAFFWGVILNIILITGIIIRVKSLKKIPGRGQGLFEVIIGGAFDFVVSVVGSEKKAKKVFPLVFSMFLLTFTANMVTFIPGQAAITIKTAGGVVPLFRTIVADYSLVFVITLISVLTTQIIAITVHGPFGYMGKFINLSGIKNFIVQAFKGKLEFGLLAQGFLDLFLGVMDIVGEVAKIISLSFRLFGNMFAAEVLTAVFLFLAPFVVPIPFLFLGLLTAIVQPFVFAVLTLIFINMASEIEEDQMIEQVTI
jgi:F-type H+-transporting ATPase subunit a